MGKSNNSIQKLSFDSELFGYPVGKVRWNSSMTEEEFLIEAKDYQLVYILSEKPIQFSSTQILPVDIKILFEKELSENWNEEEVVPIQKFRDRTAERSIHDSLLFLGLESGKFSRFNLDPRLTSKEFEKLYELWIEKALDSGNILVAPDLAGMVTFEEKENFAEIGLVAVHPNHRRKSWGRKLIQAVELEIFNRGISKLKIPTQQSNIPAMNLYEHIGYSIAEKIWVYHFWRN
ncbi:MAG: GNAT family N-acetyltransferase [Algoriphagus sp.]|uniref:GNAT family N-acetyltransferase n=1 Tax=Algoriphagus sp. TaxID=1872435 RepID=UPI0017C8021A|nr:GNAT family N-acetyltransferase [Algoriphagus sp.]NVJ86790.1 GNAT family N-acetyltransferase [Algoriphagus sp.]